MDIRKPAIRIATFGPFSFDFSSLELRQNGVKMRLEEKPARILAILIEHSGVLVSREELRSNLWPNGIHIDFNHGLNKSINKLRRALGDSGAEPRLIETLARRGYRLMIPVEALNGSSAPPASQAAPPEIRPSAAGIRAGNFRKTVWVVAGGVLIFLGVIAGTILWKAEHPAFAFHNRDLVLITNFENRTGEPVFDGSLEYALTRELSTSQFVNVAPPDRIEDTLRLMRRPLNTRIDGPLGREICLRDVGIRALLTGRFEKVGENYVLGVQLIDPGHGAVIASFSEEAPDEKHVLAAIHRLSNRVRESLGEQIKSIQQSNQEQAPVTTPSLRALQLYTQAEYMLPLSVDMRPVELLKQAVIEDPGFASAYTSLAWAIQDQGGQPEEYLRLAKRGFELSQNASERERYFIEASYYQLSGNDEKAIASYEALVRRYPGDDEGVANLGSLYNRQGRGVEAISLILRHAELRPNNLVANVQAAYVLIVDRKNPTLAEPFLQRATANSPAEDDTESFDASMWVELLPVHDAWLNDDIPRTMAELTRVEKTSALRDNARFQFGIGWVYVTLGQLQEAEKRFEGLSNAYWRNHSLTQLAFIRGDMPAFRDHLNQLRKAPTQSPLVTVLSIRAGYLNDAERRAFGLQRGGYSVSGAAYGELALARGNTARGITLLEEEVAKSQSQRHPTSYLAAESLARAYQKQGNLEAAARVLKRMSEERAKLYPPTGVMYSVYWMRTQLQLAQIYREMGRNQDAQTVEAELRKLLAYADPNHPILVELNRTKTIATALPPVPAKN